MMLSNLSKHQLIYHFGNMYNEGDASMIGVLGSKGANLAEMSNLCLPIPPGFVISTEVCKYFYANQETLPDVLHHKLTESIKKLEQNTGKIFGKHGNLLLSVRSGSVVSMPGMMDTVLNLGMNDHVAQNLARLTNDQRFALDSYRRFLRTYGSVVLGIKDHIFEDACSFGDAKNCFNQHEHSIAILEKTISAFKDIISKHANLDFLENPFIQLESAIIAVIKSWMSNRAKIYRNIHNISDVLGTAVNIQSMVFGNMGASSGTGVVFTRSPSNGLREIFGEFLANAQGEDIVSGTRTPMPIFSKDVNVQSMNNIIPKAFDQLLMICDLLEKHYNDVQDIEFTVEDGSLYILQTRAAKRTMIAATKIAVDMVNEGLISKSESLMRIDPDNLNQLLHTGIDYSLPLTPIVKGLAASPGAATGVLAFSTQDAEELSAMHSVILVRNDTSPEDIKGMHIASGMITVRGGMTSHAAVVARGIGKPCICGISNMIIDEANKTITIGDHLVLKQGDQITIDGSIGQIFLGQIPLTQPKFSEEFQILLKWSDQFSNLRVRSNAETILDANNAKEFGAVGIGLCRTEHMFFNEEKISLMQQMIIAPSVSDKMSTIKNLSLLHTKDLIDLFRVMNGDATTVRFLDPPLHEFLPKSKEEKIKISATLNLSSQALEDRLKELHETNPMLGHRGCRLGVTYPEIYQMQIESICEAVYFLKINEDIDSQIELMIPFISDISEIRAIKSYIMESVLTKQQEKNHHFKFQLGTMIELPRAALIASEIAKEVDFFSFGTNDLTQTTYGISRDDAASFIPNYLTKNIFFSDPFMKIDEIGVGELMKIAIDRGRTANPKLKFGVCGEHAGDPKSIDFFNTLGVDYISCSPYRIPIARVAAAQAAIKK